MPCRRKPHGFACTALFFENPVQILEKVYDNVSPMRCQGIALPDLGFFTLYRYSMPIVIPPVFLEDYTPICFESQQLFLGNSLLLSRRDGILVPNRIRVLPGWKNVFKEHCAMKIALASAPVKNRDVAFNLQAMVEIMARWAGKADLIVFGETALQGFGCLCWDYDNMQ